MERKTCFRNFIAQGDILSDGKTETEPKQTQAGIWLGSKNVTMKYLMKTSNLQNKKGIR